MKNESILNSLGQVSDEYIAEASPIKLTNGKRRWVKWGSLAACLALTLFSIMRLIPREAPGGNDLKLPMLTIAENTSGGLGFEGSIAYSVSELVNGNPWNEAVELLTLPVYKNQLTFDENYLVSGGDFDAMGTFLLDVAARLGMDTDNLDIIDNTPSDDEQTAIIEKFGGDVPKGYFDPTKVVAENNGIKIEVDTNMTATIIFEPAVSLPNEYNFTHYASYKDTVAVAGYLKNAYKDLIRVNDPQVNIYGGDYNIYLQQNYNIEFYGSSDDIANRIINYNFNRVAFYCDDNGKLFLARVFGPNLSGKVGDYPIISVNKATELLSNGNYITTVPYEIPGLDSVAKVELIYRTGQLEKYYMPYYRFYIELPDIEADDGLKTFGSYYVPAVDGEYIANMPVWDGGLN